MCEHTKKRYDVFIKFLKTWGKIKSSQDCNVSKVRSMDEYLHRQDKAQCTIYDYHKYLKLFINDAMIDGLIEQNPYIYLSNASSSTQISDALSYAINFSSTTSFCISLKCCLSLLHYPDDGVLHLLKNKLGGFIITLKFDADSE